MQCRRNACTEGTKKFLKILSPETLFPIVLLLRSKEVATLLGSKKWGGVGEGQSLTVTRSERVLVLPLFIVFLVDLL